MTVTAKSDTKNPVAAAEQHVAEAEHDLEGCKDAETQTSTTATAALDAETAAAERGAGEKELKQLAAERRSASDVDGWAQTKTAGAEKRLTTAREKLVEAETVAQGELVRDVCREMIKVDGGIDKNLRGVVCGLQKRIDLADELVIASDGMIGRPPSRHMRGTHLIPIVLTPLARLLRQPGNGLSGDLSMPHSSFRDTTLVQFERRLFKSILGNGAVVSTNNDTPEKQ